MVSDRVVPALYIKGSQIGDHFIKGAVLHEFESKVVAPELGSDLFLEVEEPLRPGYESFYSSADKFSLEGREGFIPFYGKAVKSSSALCLLITRYKV
jgi:hypothetical protein